MKLHSILIRVSRATVVLMALGWCAVVFTAVFLQGGHPPLSAFVAMGVIVASWILGTIGLLAAFFALRAKAHRGSAVFVAAILNAGFLAFSVIVIFM